MFRAFARSARFRRLCHLPTAPVFHHFLEVLSDMSLEEIRPASEVCNVGIRARQEDAVRSAAQHSPDNLLRNGLWMKRIVHKVALVKAFKESGARVALADDDGSHLGGLEDGGKLGLTESDDDND